MSRHSRHGRHLQPYLPVPRQRPALDGRAAAAAAPLADQPGEASAVWAAATGASTAEEPDRALASVVAASLDPVAAAGTAPFPPDQATDRQAAAQRDVAPERAAVPEAAPGRGRLDQPAAASGRLAVAPSEIAPGGDAVAQHEAVHGREPSRAGEDDPQRTTCTQAQLRRFIKSRPWIPLHELRRRFGIAGVDDDVTPVRVGETTIYVGLPATEARLLGELLAGGDVGYELSLDPGAPIVVGVYPMRPVPRG